MTNQGRKAASEENVFRLLVKTAQENKDGVKKNYFRRTLPIISNRVVGTKQKNNVTSGNRLIVFSMIAVLLVFLLMPFAYSCPLCGTPQSQLLKKEIVSQKPFLTLLEITLPFLIILYGTYRIK